MACNSELVVSCGFIVLLYNFFKSGINYTYIVPRKLCSVTVLYEMQLSVKTAQCFENHSRFIIKNTWL